MLQSRGNWVNGAWQAGRGDTFESFNPATDQHAVFTTHETDTQQVEEAIAAAEDAFWKWSDLTGAQRVAFFEPLTGIINARAEDLATAITQEMGKPFRESLAEAKSLPGKVRMSIEALTRLPDLALAGAPGISRWEPHGVTAVIGPFNYPIHLVHTHVIPALLAGSSVVVKPSEITPLAGQIYAEIMAGLNLPPGVFNVIQGRGKVGATLAGHPRVRCVAFTGSWEVGRRIMEMNLDQPDKLLALEMGGKNTVLVAEDADLRQALHEIIVGVCLTSGQRCTATSRLVVHEKVADRLLKALTTSLQRIQPGDPFDDRSFMGPLGTHAARERLKQRLDRAIVAGAEVLVDAKLLPGGAYVTPSMFLVKGSSADEYVHQELFAPHLTVETFSNYDDVTERLRKSPYGLSFSVFSRDEARFLWFQKRVRSGIYNFNRSTNNASGLLPFGGLGKSGNHRPAGSASALYSAWPVAVLHRQPGALDPDPRVLEHVADVLDTLP